jgi:hypothetical protein
MEWRYPGLMKGPQVVGNSGSRVVIFVAEVLTMILFKEKGVYLLISLLDWFFDTEKVTTMDGTWKLSDLLLFPSLSNLVC